MSRVYEDKQWIPVVYIVVTMLRSVCQSASNLISLLQGVWIFKRAGFLTLVLFPVKTQPKITHRQTRTTGGLVVLLDA